MSNKATGEMGWTARTIAIAIMASVLGLLLALALQSVSAWPQWDYFEFVFGALCGATAVHAMHRQRPLVVLLVFVPVMTAMLLVGTILFRLFVLGDRIDL
jgi:hypothetical protein